MVRTDILLPTCNRLASLVMTLGGVAAQTTRDMRVIVADQSDQPVADDPVVQTLGRVIEERGGAVEWHHRPRLHGIAEQRDFLLRQATADTVLYLDDDVLMEPWVLERLLAADENVDRKRVTLIYRPHSPASAAHPLSGHARPTRSHASHAVAGSAAAY